MTYVFVKIQFKLRQINKLLGGGAIKFFTNIKKRTTDWLVVTKNMWLWKRLSRKIIKSKGYTGREKKFLKTELLFLS